MIAFFNLVFHVVVSPFKTRAQLEAEVVLLRHQLSVLRRRVPSKPKLAVVDRLFFVWLYRLFPSVLSAVAIVQPETIIRLSVLRNPSGHGIGLPMEAATDDTKLNEVSPQQTTCSENPYACR